MLYDINYNLPLLLRAVLKNCDIYYCPSTIAKRVRSLDKQQATMDFLTYYRKTPVTNGDNNYPYLVYGVDKDSTLTSPDGVDQFKAKFVDLPYELVYWGVDSLGVDTIFKNWFFWEDYHYTLDFVDSYGLLPDGDNDKWRIRVDLTSIEDTTDLEKQYTEGKYYRVDMLITLMRVVLVKPPLKSKIIKEIDYSLTGGDIYGSRVIFEKLLPEN